MSNKQVVYVVGGPEAAKRNQWLHMTNNKAEADRLCAEIKGGQMKEITVPPSRHGR